jgi:hypothetical protein
MPRPTAPQFAYGLVTVVLATLAMLLLSQTSSGAGVTVIVLAALGLGLLVAVTVPLPRGPRTPPQAGSTEHQAENGASAAPAVPGRGHGTARRGHGRRGVRVP